MAENESSSTTPKRRYGYKQLREFDPQYFHAWSASVRGAFRERSWTSFLDTEPTTTERESPSTSMDEAFAFLQQSIPLKYGISLANATTPWDIWTSLQQRYTTKSREDEVRLEGQLLNLVKDPKMSLDDHIEKFETLISTILDIQPEARQYDEIKINSYYLRTLELLHDPNEDWKGFIAMLGKTWMEYTRNQLYSESITYYHTHILPHIRKTTSPESDAPKILATSTTRGRGNSDTRGSYRGRGRGNSGNYRGNFQSNRGNYQQTNRPSYPSDPNEFCAFHDRWGHSTEQCVAMKDYVKEKRNERNTNTTNQQRNFGNQQSGNQQRSYGQQQQQQPPQQQQQNAPQNYSRNNYNQQGPARAAQIQTTALQTSTTSDTRPWLYDSCCSDNMTGNFEYLHDYRPFDEPQSVTGIGNTLLYGHGIGTAILQSDDNDKNSIHELTRTWYVPGLKDSIISHHWTRFNDISVSIDENHDYHLYSLQPGSTFQLKSEQIHRLTTLPQFSNQSTIDIDIHKSFDNNSTHHCNTIGPRRTPYA
jgi:hypothetical protein